MTLYMTNKKWHSHSRRRGDVSVCRYYNTGFSSTVSGCR